MTTDLGADLRFAMRRALRRKWSAAAVLATVALASGATGALFTAVDRILLRELPVREPDRVYWVRTVQDGTPRKGLNPGDAYDLSTRVRSFAGMSVYNQGEQTFRFGDDGAPERVVVGSVEQNMPDVLGITPLLGRFYGPDDYASPSPNLVITHRLWRRAFNRDTAVIGRTVYLNNVPRTIIGVLPPAADVLPQGDFEMWRPLVANLQQRQQARTATFLTAVARLRDGIAPEVARQDLLGVARGITAEQPATNANRSFALQPLRDGVVGPARPTFLLLGGALCAVLLIGCASVGNLLAARSHARSHELAIRAALGGRTFRLVQQVLTESTLLCAIGGLLGLALAPAILRGFVSVYPGLPPRAAELTPDLRSLAASFVAIVLAGLAASIPTIRKTVRLDFGDALRTGSRSSGSKREQRVARGLVVGQLALSVVLLFGGGLLLKSYRTLVTRDPGFDAEHILSFDVTPSLTRYSTNELLDGYYATVFERLSALPGVRAVGMSNLIPFGANDWTEGFGREGTEDAPPYKTFATYQIVTDGYFNAMGLALRRGRFLAPADRDSAPFVVVVNETMARQLAWENPIGRRLSMRGNSYEIVGVVGDKRHKTMAGPVLPEMYVSRFQVQRQLSGWIVLRATGDPTLLAPSVRSVVGAVDPTIAVAHVATMADRRDDIIAPDRFRAWVVGGFAVVALLLAALGLYGVIAFAVAQRTREIGIRIALGQDPRAVQWSVVRGALSYSAVGLAIGVSGALVAARLLRGFVVGAETADLRVLGAVCGMFVLVSLVAAFLPARRASRIDPLVALRAD